MAPPGLRIVSLLLALLAVSRSVPAQAAHTIVDCETMRKDLRTANPGEEADIAYYCALVERNRLPAKVVDTAYQWARLKPYPQKVQYFKSAVITQAAKLGIKLPQHVPRTASTIEGRVVIKLLVVEVPVSGINVVVEETGQSTVTDGKGRFRFTDVPFGRHTVRASGVALFRPRTGSAVVSLPSRPPSTEAASVQIVVK